MKEKESVLVTAEKLVTIDRQSTYGSPHDNLGRTAKIWSAILGIEITSAQVALCMIGVKISREVVSPKHDNRVDMAGYTKILDTLQPSAFDE